MLAHPECSQVQTRLHQYSGDQLAELLGAFARLRFAPSSAWLQHWEVAVQPKLQACSAEALARGVWALVQLRHQPAVSWLYSFMLATYSRQVGPGARSGVGAGVGSDIGARVGSDIGAEVGEEQGWGRSGAWGQERGMGAGAGCWGLCCSCAMHAPLWKASYQ